MTSNDKSTCYCRCDNMKKREGNGDDNTGINKALDELGMLSTSVKDRCEYMKKLERTESHLHLFIKKEETIVTGRKMRRHRVHFQIEPYPTKSPKTKIEDKLKSLSLKDNDKTE